MLFLLLVFWALQFLYAEKCASLQLTHLRRVPFRHAPGGQVVAAHLTHLLMFLHPLLRCPNYWQFMLMYFRMFVVVLPIVIFVCVICFSISSLFTLKRIIVEVRLPFCFLCSPSVSMLSFLSSASISCKLI